MTECSKPLDLVKNKIFFFGDVGAANPEATIRARRHHETVSFLDMARQPNTQLWREKKIMPPSPPARARFNGAGTASSPCSLTCLNAPSSPAVRGVCLKVGRARATGT